MKGTLLALCSVLLVSMAQLLLRAAMANFPPLSELLQHLKLLLLLGSGLSAYALSMLIWMLALKHLPLNRLYPLLSLSYVLVWLAAISLPVFGEPFRWSGLVGMLLIIVGVFNILVSRQKTG
ncbi:4-amino-4-deoxy-L-arabinose-phosphoundecaprenol flippase subunit ArnF [Pantoea agglomerans]|uniref:4-amino-4-deoxy-L-arabinose-phosphoundecaprenol flippase subunit ArnF n=1 Tax=Enterobacter agglomerans TaxID=549 RepID=UPI0007E581E8|nr:4-amino-4-deoxy-L-arabinose-phosphoundecaprenol flippase subunit ArnF [Pantoea agglomerans]WHU89989.1 4-amino-4-deoxy-L-arabinose-phosphoundecaprenol flippase subunit ArnF [Pantoea agglomerans pv. gypsophilae]WNN36615.1 4-amino-4-deoxy-L-arabinose-phosphoundecaprenol flippase subunit ArnF [Pantoea agglomerans]